MNYKKRGQLIVLLSAMFVLAACKGGGSDSAPADNGSPQAPAPSSSNWDQAVWDQSNWS